MNAHDEDQHFRKTVALREPAFARDSTIPRYDKSAPWFRPGLSGLVDGNTARKSLVGRTNSYWAVLKN